MDGIPPVPDKFYCEICRLDRADPYVVFPSYFSRWGGVNCSEDFSSTFSAEYFLSLLQVPFFLFVFSRACVVVLVKIICFSPNLLSMIFCIGGINWTYEMITCCIVVTSLLMFSCRGMLIVVEAVNLCILFFSDNIFMSSSYE